MRALSATELLGVWERGLTQAPVQRALELLAAASVETPRDSLAGLSIGRRDASLLTLRERTFGPRMASLVVCPHCGQQLELTFNVDDVRAGSPAEPAPEIAMTISSYEVQFRLPNSADVAAVAERPDSSEKRQLLFERCLLAARCNGEATTPNRLPADVIDAVAERMAQTDPQADVQLGISCPSCGHRWRAALDVVSFFWSEIDAWAHRVLREVHTLASAYGWHESEILALSPWRRQLYLEMVGA
jgi:hypothetical protein